MTHPTGSISGEAPASNDGSPTPEILGLLTEGDMRLIDLMPNASNYTFLAEVHHENRSARVVYKPQRGEAPLWDFPEGTLCRREVAAFLLSQALGWPSIPPTVLREGPHGVGSVQLYVEADPAQHYFTLRERSLEPFRPVAAFDVVANNADRKGGHCLRDARGSIWVVDHGVCFSPEPKLRTVIWDFAGDPVPTGLLADVARVAKELRSGELRERLLELLTDPEVDATRRRGERLAGSGRFPLPGRRRSYPWPPV